MRAITAWVESPFEHVALDHDRSRDLTFLATLLDGRMSTSVAPASTAGRRSWGPVVPSRIARREQVVDAARDPLAVPFAARTFW